ncbi:MAG TPA: hypothetical protein PK413_19005 [Thermoanaerobaculia bacterium]|nr:hypothetical protein [Thermoanaerobaculia bacterium]
MTLPVDVIALMQRYDAEIARLQDLRLPPYGKGYLEAVQARQQEVSQQRAEEKRLWQQIDATLLPVLLAAYRRGGDAERAAIRDLLKQCRKLAWGLGWAHRDQPPDRKAPLDAETLQRRLLLLAMKDGLVDWRDEIVALDELCGRAQRSGLDTGALLHEAAGLASDQPRGSRASLRAVLSERANRL